MKMEFILALKGEASDHEETFTKTINTLFENGIRPVEYWKSTVTDPNNNIVDTVTLVQCKERWHGAAKRFFKKTKITNIKQKVDGLPVFG